MKNVCEFKYKYPKNAAKMEILALEAVFLLLILAA